MKDKKNIEMYLKDIRIGKVSVHAEPEIFKNVSLAGLDFSDMDLSGADFSGSNLMKCNFSGSNLIGVNFENADLTGVNLSKCNLTDAKCSKAGFGYAKFENTLSFSANFNEATFTKVTAKKSDFRCSVLTNIRARDMLLLDCDCTAANFKGANLMGSNVKNSVFDDAVLINSRLNYVKNYKTASWIGVDIRDVNFAGAYRVRRFIMDQNYLKEFRTAGKFNLWVYYLWKITSNCGESAIRWILFIGVQVAIFALLYEFVGVDYGDYETALSPLYFSFVVMTTLGFGDVVPNSLLSQILVMLQVSSGYIMLGGLLAIMANKMTKRAD